MLGDGSRRASAPKGLTPPTLPPVFFYPHGISQLELGFLNVES